jgi:hypothetical protein
MAALSIEEPSAKSISSMPKPASGSRNWLSMVMTSPVAVTVTFRLSPSRESAMSELLRSVSFSASTLLSSRKPTSSSISSEPSPEA